MHNLKCTATKGQKNLQYEKRERREKNTQLLLESHVTVSISVCVNNNTVGRQRGTSVSCGSYSSGNHVEPFEGLPG